MACWPISPVALSWFVLRKDSHGHDVARLAPGCQVPKSDVIQGRMAFNVASDVVGFHAAVQRERSLKLRQSLHALAGPHNIV